MIIFTARLYECLPVMPGTIYMSRDRKIYLGADEMTQPLRKERRSENLPMITWLSGLGERGESIKNKSLLRLLPLPGLALSLSLPLAPLPLPSVLLLPPSIPISPLSFFSLSSSLSSSNLRSSFSVSIQACVSECGRPGLCVFVHHCFRLTNPLHHHHHHPYPPFTHTQTYKFKKLENFCFFFFSRVVPDVPEPRIHTTTSPLASHFPFAVSLFLLFCPSSSLIWPFVHLFL